MPQMPYKPYKIRHSAEIESMFDDSMEQDSTVVYRSMAMMLKRICPYTVSSDSTSNLMSVADDSTPGLDISFQAMHFLTDVAEASSTCSDSCVSFNKTTRMSFSAM